MTATAPHKLSPDYEIFLASKAPRPVAVGIEPGPIRDSLYDFQKSVTEFCISQGRAALFLDTGLGKSACILEWCDQMTRASNGYALILTPLAVARQFEREGQKFGIAAKVIRHDSEVSTGINICNYDRLDDLNVARFSAVALDESSVLKAFSGKTTRKLIERFKDTPYRLCATATPAPNDHMELGNHAEFLGIMPSNEMLARWFISDQTKMGSYRLKQHGISSFWDWVASWARCAESPDDLGFDGSRFVLPPMNVIRHRAFGDVRAPAGSLFIEDMSATNIHSVKRQTAEMRAKATADLVNAEPNMPWLIWVDTDYEADAMARFLPDAIELRGSMTSENKELAIERFLSETTILVTKPSIAGMGLNFQHCARVVYVGRSFSYESFYQSVRRCWRYGQKNPVDVHIMVAEGEDQIGRVIDRKAEDHGIMKRAMAAAMRRVSASSEIKMSYNPTHIGRTPEWLKSCA
ncbi:MAG: helicase-related protein [Acidobacteriaceae bacterium]